MTLFFKKKHKIGLLIIFEVLRALTDEISEKHCDALQLNFFLFFIIRRDDQSNLALPSMIFRLFSHWDSYDNFSRNKKKPADIYIIYLLLTDSLMLVFTAKTNPTIKQIWIESFVVFFSFPPKVDTEVAHTRLSTIHPEILCSVLYYTLHTLIS
jgi:hypothetical protein